MLQFLESKLYSDVEGTCSGQFGYIIAVVSMSDIGNGIVMPGSGQAEFVARYRAIVFKPFKGEVVDGVVNNVTKVRQSTFVQGSETPIFSRWAFSRKLDPSPFSSHIKYVPISVTRHD
jgi:DNA-directed RNA polymerase subunit E'/Rpb7